MQLTSLMEHKNPKENESVTNKAKSKDEKIKTKLLYLTLSQGNIRPVDQAIALDRLRFRQVPHITLIDGRLESSQIEVVPQREKHIRPAHLDQQTSLTFPCETVRTKAPDPPACLRFVCARVSARPSFVALSLSHSPPSPFTLVFVHNRNAKIITDDMAEIYLVWALGLTRVRFP
jgi:hypothetical protein